ncbi:CMP/dCMP deaminase zinc-binding [Rhodopseudomonas palustris TIE-1]|uniref:anti-phage dCTP deaminase n=1 Tax=Rhodopseudomonas palustris TaxID=1076 RepID=UPI0001779747|nr:anti-phage dCTP deaminase [Rhodopseudomonas palustris]ACF01828.1 CMP/dCMP deaminase zinc-binding [Rhodopseudomonas palustris TIE-1]
MPDSVQNINFPELVFGFVCPIGADMSGAIQSVRQYFEKQHYRVVEIKVTDIFALLEKYYPAKEPLDRSSLHKRYKTYIAYGNHVRAHFGDDALAAFAVRRIMAKRLKTKDNDYSKTIYLLHQFKRKEEIELLRSIYGRLFFQVSIYARRSARVDYLARLFANSEHVPQHQKFRPIAEELVQNDQNEAGEPHGQRVGKIFHDADFIATTDAEIPMSVQITRFCELLFGSNGISPTRDEYGLFLAKAAALRSLDLSRQVGAAIFSPSGEVISLGSNEVPKAGGGTYWSDDKFDDRDYKRLRDSNFVRKKEILAEIVKAISPNQDISEVMSIPAIKDSQLMDALEYGRIVHAEMSAISDAARKGLSIADGILFTTTFPCHLCAKHIVASGIKKVIFLEPYPKSLASDLHSDSIRIEGADRGHYQKFPAVDFEHFFGITPRRYREIFERTSRKDEADGSFRPYKTDQPTPIVRIGFPYYIPMEEYFTHPTYSKLKAVAGEADLISLDT